MTQAGEQALSTHEAHQADQLQAVGGVGEGGRLLCMDDLRIRPNCSAASSRVWYTLFHASVSLTLVTRAAHRYTGQLRRCEVFFPMNNTNHLVNGAPHH